MFSEKKLYLFFLLPLFLTLTVRCGGEDQPYRETPQVSFKSGKTQCLENFADTINLYFSGEAKASDLEDFWDCFSDSVKMFTTFTHGQSQDVFLATELRNFMQRYFLGKTVVNDDLLHSLMQLKRVFVGGSDRYFSRTELEYCRRLIERLKGLSLEALPHIRLYTMKIDPKDFSKHYSTDQFIQALAVLKGVNSRLGDIPLSHNEAYSFLQLDQLLKNLEDITSPNLKTQEMSFRQYIPLLKKIKAVLIGPNEEVIEGREWGFVFDSIYLTYSNTVRSKYYLIPGRWSYGESFHQFGLMVNEVLKGFEQAIYRTPLKRIEHEKIDGIFDELDNIITWPLGLHLAAVKSTWYSLVEKVFTPEERRLHKDPGLDVEVLRSVLYEFNHWHQAQVFINEYTGNALISDNKSTQELFLLNDHFSMSKVDFGSPEDEMRRIMFGPIHLVLDDLSRFRLDPKEPQPEYNAESLFVLNWQRVIARLIVKAYATNIDRRNNLVGLTPEELGTAYTDFKEIAIGIGLADEGESPEEFSGSIYKLSALFMPRSDGDGIIQLEEAIEYISYAISGVNGGDYFTDLAKQNCQVLQTDKGDSIEAACFREMIRRYPGQYFGGLPKLLKSFLDMPTRDSDERENYSKEKFIFYLEQAVREEGAADTPISISDVAQGIILSYYIETYMTLFDKDGDGVISLENAMIGFPRYKDILGKLADFDSEGKTEALYTYLLKYAEKPETLGQKIKFGLWSVTPWRWKSIAADRMMLIQILGLLASESQSLN